MKIQIKTDRKMMASTKAITAMPVTIIFSIPFSPPPYSSCVYIVVRIYEFFKRCIMDINERIFALLLERNVSQKELASSIHASTGLVTDWKNNRSTPKMKYICAIADYFGVSVDYLLGRESSAAGMELSPEEQELIACYRLATQKEREDVFYILREYRATPAAPIVKDA